MGTSQNHILQSLGCWLPQTMVWMYEQLLNLPDQYVPHIVCDEVQNTDQFKIDNLHWANANSLFARLKKRIAHRLDIVPPDLFIERTARQIGISLIHSHFGNVAWLNLRTAARLAVPHIVSFYGFDVRFLPTGDPAWKKRYRKLFSEADLVLALGPNMAAELEGMGCTRQKIKIHHLGVDLKHLPFKPRQWNSGQTLRVLIAGTFKEKKGIPYALEALNKIREYADMKITIIGNATHDERDQIEKKRIIETVHKLKLETTVKFLGYQPYDILLKEAYDHHIFMAPSITANDGDTEGIPMTTVEMAASGMPVISTFHADIPEIIENGKTGWLVQERSAEDLASCLHFLISNPEKWEPVLKTGRERMEKEFDAHKQGVKLGEIYKQVLCKSRHD